MQNDAVFHMEIRFDAYSADVSWAMFRNRGVLPIHANAGELSFDFEGEPPFTTKDVLAILALMLKEELS
jgi:hypothetical protein